MVLLLVLLLVCVFVNVQLDGAMLCFVTALDLDPKDRTAIKAAIDNLHSGSAGLDEEDEQEM